MEESLTMSKKPPQFHWEKQTVDSHCEEIECPVYDEYKDFTLEPTGYYVLIRVNHEIKMIEVALCNKEHKIVKIFRGNSPQQIYHQIFKQEKMEGVVWFSEKDHMAYLGKELKKAEISLLAGDDSYVQE